VGLEAIATAVEIAEVGLAAPFRFWDGPEESGTLFSVWERIPKSGRR